MAIERHGTQFDWRNLLAQVGDHYPLASLAGRRLFEVAATAQSHDGIYFMCLGKQLGIRLRQTSGHDYAGGGIELARASCKPETFGVRPVSNGAGIDDIDFSRTVEFGSLHP